LDYARLVALLIEAIKEQQREIEQLKAAIVVPSEKSDRKQLFFTANYSWYRQENQHFLSRMGTPG
jgi:hypothetical protein